MHVYIYVYRYTCIDIYIYIRIRPTLHSCGEIGLPSSSFLFAVDMCVLVIVMHSVGA